MKKTFISILIILCAINSYSTHLMGGEITYKCIKAGSKAGFYVFQVKIYRDCMGIPLDTTSSLTVHNHPTISSIPLAYIGSNDISPVCDTINNSNMMFNCGSSNLGFGGNGIGAVEEHIYLSDTLRIPGTPNSDGWHFTWSDCCRNGAIINILNPSSFGFTLRTALYPFTDSLGVVYPNSNDCYDSSPEFYEKPRTILETNNGYDASSSTNGFTYSHNAFDQELDSLSYEFAPPLDELGYNYSNPNSTAIPFSSGFSFQMPINGITINSSTGRTQYPADIPGNYVTCTKVSSFRCGQLISEVFREIQVVLIPPTCNLGDTTNGNIGADTLCNVRPIVQPPFYYPNLLPQYQWDTLVHCGDTVRFDFIANDNDIYPNGSSQDLLFEVSGGQFHDYSNNQPCLNPPCATFSQIGTGNSPPFISAGGFGGGQFEWVTSCNHLVGNCSSQNRPVIYTFVIKVSDDFCSAPAIENTSQIISVTVFPPCDNLKIPISTLDASCNLDDGSAIVNPFGGFPPYNKYWYDFSGSVVNPDSLRNGDYILRVTDSTQCEVIDTFTIGGPQYLPQITSNINNVSCYGLSDGEINIYGDSSLNFLWNTGDTIHFLNNLVAGAYSLLTTDSFGCNIIDTFYVSEPQSINFSYNYSNVSCYGFSDGSIDVLVSGGIQPYSYLWSTGDTIEDLNSLDTGVYSLYISDSNGCNLNSSLIDISEPVQIQNIISSSSVSCNGINNGLIVNNTSGGIYPYSYNWNTGDTLSSLYNISGGLYSLVITDSNNCTYLDSIFVFEPTELISNITDSSGVITGVAYGGTPPYTYEFFGPNGFLASNSNNMGTSFSITPITNGTYWFVVTDDNNCVDSISISYNSDFSPTVLVNLSNYLCDSLSSLTIEVSQDSGEVDMSTALFQSNSGSFDISNFNLGDTIGTAVLMAGGGSIYFNTMIMVSSIISSSQAIIVPCDSINGCLGSFVITNSPNGGVEILTQSVPDGNNFTAGNMSSITFDNVFINPCGPLVFTTTINSELGDIDIQNLTFLLTFEDLLDLSKLSIYPNPTNQFINISFLSNNRQDITISIINLIGERLFFDELYDFNGNYERIIDLSNYPSSIYMLNISNGNKRFNSKIIKN